METNSPFKSIIKGASFVFAGNFIVYAILFLYHIPVVRILGPEKYGIWQIVFTIITSIGPLSLLGLGSGVMFYCSRSSATKSREETAGILNSSFKIIFVSSFITVLIMLGVNFGFIERFYPYDNIKTILFIFIFAIPFLSFERIGESIFRAVGNARMPYQVKILYNAARLAFIPCALWLTKGNLAMMSFLMLLCHIAAGMYMGFLINRHILPLKEIIKGSAKKYRKKLLSYSWPLMITDYVLILGKKADIFLIGYFLGSRAVGIYAPAVILSDLLWIVPQAITYLLFPALNKLNSDGDKKGFVDLSERVYKYMIYLNLPALCFMAIFSKNILDFLYGSRYSDGYLALIVLSVVMAAQIFYQISYYILGITQKTKQIMIINVIGMSFNLIANYFLIPAYGIIGAATATLGSSILMGILAIIAAIRIQGKFIFPIKTIGIIFLSAMVLILVFLFKDRMFFCNLLIFSSYFVLTMAYGILFEKQEIKKGVGIIRNRLKF
ncbi:MAG: flippase [Elusimicrobia bacterium]|nr:flippase [Elusimicrobiota bacterium]